MKVKIVHRIVTLDGVALPIPENVRLISHWRRKNGLFEVSLPLVCDVEVVQSFEEVSHE